MQQDVSAQDKAEVLTRGGVSESRSCSGKRHLLANFVDHLHEPRLCWPAGRTAAESGSGIRSTSCSA